MDNKKLLCYYIKDIWKWRNEVARFRKDCRTNIYDKELRDIRPSCFLFFQSKLHNRIFVYRIVRPFGLTIFNMRLFSDSLEKAG
jgi:hypothetical protein